MIPDTPLGEGHQKNGNASLICSWSLMIRSISTLAVKKILTLCICLSNIVKWKCGI